MPTTDGSVKPATRHSLRGLTSQGPLRKAANVLLSRTTRFSTLKRWALEVARRRGVKRAKVALARKLASVLHRMWIDGSEFRWGKEALAA